MSIPQAEAAFDLTAATDEWRHALIEVGGNNRLLFHRDTASVIRLPETGAAIEKLLEGGVVRLTELVESGTALATAKRACAAIARKEREAREEYGVSISYLAVGLASWDPSASERMADAVAEEVSGSATASALGKSSRTPLAPVLLRAVEVRRRQGAQDSWELQLVEDFQLNGVLTHVLNSDKRRIDVDDVEGIDGADQGDIELALDLVRSSCSDIPEFVIDPSLMIGTFTYMKQPMVNDISDTEALGKSTLVRALAGDSAAVRDIRDVRDATELRDPDYTPVDSEYLVLDADASQSYVVNAAIAGRTMVVQGPPGTGKSQTIANLIANLTASGKSVLFVAQKRAAVEAVLDRLDQTDLGHLVLDLFAATGSRRYVAEQLRVVLDRQQSALAPDVATLHTALDMSRRQLVDYHDQLHARAHGMGLSLADLRNRSLALVADAPAALLIPSRVFDDWDDSTRVAMGAKFEELHAIGALTPSWDEQHGWNPTQLQTHEQEREASLALSELAYSHMPQVFAGIERLKHDVTLSIPTTWGDLDSYASVVEAAVMARRAAGPLIELGVSDDELREMRAAFDRRYARDTGLKMGWGSRRTLRKRARSILGPAGIGQRDVATVTEQVQWVRACCSDPSATDWLEPAVELVAAVARARRIASTVSAKLRGINLDLTPLERMSPLLDGLAADPRKPQMPRVAELREQLFSAHLGPLLQHMGTRVRDGESGLIPSAVLDAALYKSLVGEAMSKSPAVASMSGQRLGSAVQTFTRMDQEHLAASAARVRRANAERLGQALNEHPEQHIELRTELSRKRNFRPLRNLVRVAPDVMFAAKPVWAMSPLQVSRVLPLSEVFDVVVFDEASQVKPADAVASLARARQAVVAGDSRQLPPTDFFSKVLEDVSPSASADTITEEEGDLDGDESRPPSRTSTESLTRDAESLLASFERVLAGQSRRLLWHYRSRDERLIAVSNAGVYDSSLTTFPAARLEDGLRYESVAPSWGAGKTTNSPDNEVIRVVELVEQHIAERPGESLGVITFGERHQRRISDALERRALENQVLREFVDHEGLERFFVKNIERVQGDERDAIIISVGYGKTPGGRVRMLWGPLLQEGGERRLNVAISRAKRRMTLVTSFQPDDLAADGHSSPGYRLMYSFIVFMASNGTDLGAQKPSTMPLNAFEIDIRDRLEAKGLSLDTQYGVGGYRLDFAVRHPDLPGRHVLAIEADGASYHSGYTARERDRLRQTLLEQRGWRFHRIWSTDWFNDADREVERAVAAYEAALAEDTVGNRDHHAGPSDAAATVPVWSEGVAQRTSPKPRFRHGLSIDEYSPSLLVELIRYYRSDGIVHTRDEELTWIVQELGFARKGSKIVAAITSAQATVARGRS